MLFNKLTFRAKLFLGFLLIILLSITFTVISLSQLNKIEENAELIYRHPLMVSNAVRDINICINGMHRSMKDVVLAENKQELDSAAKVVNELNSQALAAFEIVFDRFLGDIKDVNDAYQAFVDWKDIRNEVIDLKRNGHDREAARITKGKGAKHVSMLLAKTKVMTDFAKNKADEFKQDIHNTYQRTFKSLILAFILVISISIFIAIVVSQSILTPVQDFIFRIRRLYIREDIAPKKMAYKSEVDLLSGTVSELSKAYKKIEEVNLKLKSLNEDLDEKVKMRTIELETKQLQLKEKNEEYAAINEELRQTNEELHIAKESAEKNEILAKEKTEEYETVNEELRQTIEELELAKTKAEENDKLKSAFLANMSHEIRTPMNGIIGFAKMLQKPDLSSKKLKHYTEVIVESSKQLLRVVNDVLDISKIETGQVEIYKEETHIEKMLEETISLFELKAQEKDLRLEWNCELQEDKVITDQAKLKQILFNLISNSIKFTEVGFVKVDCELNDNKLLFSVRDSGIGIPKSEHHKIFDRFSKIEYSTTKLYSGTGLGLSICKGYVETLGGDIWFESEKDEGASFLFTIPYEKAESPLEQVISETEKEKEFFDATILVVEDEDFNFNYLEELLANRRINYIRAKTGKEALDIFKKNLNIDLILMDIRLPEMDGYAVTKEIRKENPKIPIIAQTAYALSGDKEKALNAGCNDYIAKPIIEEQFNYLIGKYLS